MYVCVCVHACVCWGGEGGDGISGGSAPFICQCDLIPCFTYLLTHSLCRLFLLPSLPSFTDLASLYFHFTFTHLSSLSHFTLLFYIHPSIQSQPLSTFILHSLIYPVLATLHCHSTFTYLFGLFWRSWLTQNPTTHRHK